MKKKQKINKKKKSQRAYGDFIHIVKYWMYSFIFVPHISNIYDNNEQTYDNNNWMIQRKKIKIFLILMVKTKTRKEIRR